jgi:hypothetical protein
VAIASLVLGIASLLAWIYPVFGLPIAILGLIAGILGRRSPRRGLAKWGIVTSSIGLVATLINAVWGAIITLRG